MTRAWNQTLHSHEFVRERMREGMELLYGQLWIMEAMFTSSSATEKRQHIRYTWGHWTPHDSLQTFMAWETFFLSLVTSTKSSADNQTLQQVYIISNVVVSTVPLLVSTLLSVLVGGGWNEFSLFTFLLLSASASRICTNIHSFVWKQPKNEFSLVPVAQ